MKKAMKFIFTLVLIGWLILSICIIGGEPSEPMSFLKEVLIKILAIISSILAVVAIYVADKKGWMLADCDN